MNNIKTETRWASFKAALMASVIPGAKSGNVIFSDRLCDLVCLLCFHRCPLAFVGFVIQGQILKQLAGGPAMQGELQRSPTSLIDAAPFLITTSSAKAVTDPVGAAPRLGRWAQAQAWGR